MKLRVAVKIMPRCMQAQLLLYEHAAHVKAVLLQWIRQNFYYLYECSHFFCTKCLKEHIDRHINSCGTTLRIQCINQACKALISEEIVQGIVDEATLRMRMCRNCSVKMDKAKFYYLYQCKHFISVNTSSAQNV